MIMLETGQFTVYATFLAKTGQYEALNKLNVESFEATKAAPGLIHMMFLKPPKEDKPFVFIAIWESKKHFSTFMKSSEAQAFHNAEAIKVLHETAMEKASAEFYTLQDVWTAPH